VPAAIVTAFGNHVTCDDSSRGDPLAASPRAAVEPDDIAALPDVGYCDLLCMITTGNTIAHQGFTDALRWSRT
jgi:hypothetical protein